MSSHIPFSKLADLAQGGLGADEKSAILAHLGECSRCGAEIAKLETAIGVMRSDESQDAPRDLIFNAINLFQSRAVADQPSLVRRIVAALSFDSFQMSPAFGVRAGQATSRQLLYNADECDLDLRISQNGETWNVAGQVLGAEFDGGHIELKSESASAVSELNEQGEFILPNLPEGNYELKLHLGDLQVEIPDLQLKA